MPDDYDLIADFEVFIRPASVLQALDEAMVRRLQFGRSRWRGNYIQLIAGWFFPSKHCWHMERNQR